MKTGPDICKHQSDICKIQIKDDYERKARGEDAVCFLKKLEK